jgi:hypothetical protein
MVHARHTCDNADWNTPAYLVEIARSVLGTIDLDPASDAQANLVVQATHYFTVADDGLSQEWAGQVFLNPPGGEVAPFWRKACASFLSQDIESLFWVGYSLEQLQTLQRVPAAWTPLTAHALCIPRTRIAFVENEAMRAKRLARIDELNAERRTRGLPPRPHSLVADAPTHANYLSYLGPDVAAFRDACQTLGQVILR